MNTQAMEFRSELTGKDYIVEESMTAEAGKEVRVAYGREPRIFESPSGYETNICFLRDEVEFKTQEELYDFVSKASPDELIKIPTATIFSLGGLYNEFNLELILCDHTMSVIPSLYEKKYLLLFFRNPESGNLSLSNYWLVKLEELNPVETLKASIDDLLLCINLAFTIDHIDVVSLTK